MSSLRIALLVILLICVVPRQSHGSFHELLRKLALGDNSSNATHQMSPSPSPVPSANLDSENDQSPQSQPTCDKVLKCDIKDYSVTACVPFVGDGSHASYVLVLNGGESFVKLNIVFLPANITLEDTVISGQVKKVNLPSNMGGNSSILLNVGNEECVIQMESLIPQGFYTSYLTPINGTYLFFVAVLFIGGTLIGCKSVKTRRHPNGVPYQELEMEQQNTNSTLVIEKQGGGWDEYWDDEWDEEKAVRSPATNHIGKVSENGASLHYIDTAQWGDDWDV